MTNSSTIPNVQCSAFEVRCSPFQSSYNPTNWTPDVIPNRRAAECPTDPAPALKFELPTAVGLVSYPDETSYNGPVAPVLQKAGNSVLLVGNLYDRTALSDSRWRPHAGKQRPGQTRICGRNTRLRGEAGGTARSHSIPFAAR